MSDVRQMGVQGLEPWTYGLKGQEGSHKFLSHLVLYAFLYVKKHCWRTTESVQIVNRERTETRMTY